MKSILPTILLLFSLTACSIPPKSDQPPNRTFRLNTAAFNLVSAHSPPKPRHNMHLYIPKISVSPGLDNRHIVILKTPYEQDVIARSQWPDELSTYLRAVITEALSASNRFSSVSNTLVNTQNTYKLLLQVSHFQVELPGRADSTPAKTANVHVSLQAFLVRSKDQQLLMQRRYQVIKTHIPLRVSELVKAMNEALGDELKQLLVDLEKLQ